MWISSNCSAAAIININYIESKFDVSVHLRGGALKITGEEAAAQKAADAIEALRDNIRNNQKIENQGLHYICDMIEQNKYVKNDYSAQICCTNRGKPIKSKTVGQHCYTDAIEHNDITFCIGPAGTGKTYLAVAMAIKAFKNGDVSRIVLVRPAVEAGERLGFLPGDLKEKVDPYLKPLYDALYDIFGTENCERHLSRGAIEIAPLAFMRGRTLDNAFVILDEAQNTTPEQMKMFLTRLGFGTKAVITGDVTQIDLPYAKDSGLLYINEILKDIKSIEFVYLTQADVVRNPIVQRIIKAYEEYEQTNARGQA
jgi:phosphate starvation-inducible PhoH-like protein